MARKKKPKTKQKKIPQLQLQIAKYSSDAAAGNNDAASWERLQRPQQEDDLVVQSFSLSKRGPSFQPAREGQGQGQGSARGGLLPHSRYGVMFSASLSSSAVSSELPQF